MTDDDDRLLPPGAVETFVDTARGRARVLHSSAAQASGDATPMLLVHGGGSDNAAISWYEVFAPLGGERAVYAVDLPGFGYTEVPPLGAPSAMAAFVDEVADRLGLDRFVAVGVSMGGDVALNLALRRPERVAALVLIAPGGLLARYGNRVAHTAAWLASRLPDPLLDAMARLANRFADVALRVVVADRDALPAPVRAEFVREARRLPTGPGYRHYNQATLGRTRMLNDLLPVVGTITAPTLLFHGELDRMVDPQGSREAAARMPDATLVLVPGCGHWAQIEARDRFLAELAAFGSRYE